MADILKKILHGATNLALFIGGLANLCIGTWAAFSSDATMAVTALTFGLILLFASTIDRFETLKGMGIEAKTRQLDNKIGQADRALASLREMTELTCEALIQLQSKMGRWDSVPEPKVLITFAVKVRDIMQSLGSDESAINNTLKPLAQILCFDIANYYVARLQNLLQRPYNEIETALINIPRPVDIGDPTYLQLQDRLHAIDRARNQLRNNLNTWQLDDYPANFMKVFDCSDELKPQILDNLKTAAAQFVPGMASLASKCTLSDPELWTDELNKARRFFMAGAKDIE